MKQSGNFVKPSLSFVCSEEWEKMSPCEQGRFCGSCQKTVVDFTQKSEPEILDYLAGQNREVCGTFYAHQLAQPAQRRMSFGRFFSAALVFFGLSFLSKEAEAQGKKLQEKKQATKVKTVAKTNYDNRTPSDPNKIEMGKVRGRPVSRPKKTKQVITGPKELLTGEVMVPGIMPNFVPDTQVVASKDNNQPEVYYLEPNPPFITANPEVMPVFKNGGDAGLQKFLKENRKITRDEAEGLVVLSFVIDTLGAVQDIKVLKALSPTTTKEALRLASLLTFEPGLMHGKKVSVRFTLPIRFSNESN